jgi:hypothetical protein
MSRPYNITPAVREQRRKAGIARGLAQVSRKYKTVRLGEDTVAEVDKARGGLSRDKWIRAAALQSNQHG